MASGVGGETEVDEQATQNAGPNTDANLSQTEKELDEK